MSLVLAIDMDGTIADWTGRAIKNAKEEYNIDIKHEDIIEPVFADLVIKKVKEQNGIDLQETGSEIYSKICKDNFYLDLDPLPGAIEAIEEIYNEGHELVFLTKPTDWSKSSNHKEMWLDKYFNHLEYTVIMVSDIKKKHLINVPVIIDDDPRALKDHPTAIPVCIAHPWNKEFVDSNEIGLVLVNELKELPGHIKFIEGILEEEKNILI